MNLLHETKATVRNAFPSLYGYLAERDKHRLAEQVDRILASPVPPQTYPEDYFDELQARSQRVWPPYAPNLFSRWHDAFNRAAQVLRLPPIHLRENLSVLEVACGSGMAGPAFASFGHSVVLHDKEDWREKRAKAIPFISGDLCYPLDAPADSFDLVCSWDSFEHIGDLKAAFAELVRLCRPGGYIYLDFGPLWCSPLGLHALNFHMAYPQFMFSPEIIEKKMREFPNGLGLRAEEDSDWATEARHMDLMNKARPAGLNALWDLGGCETISLKQLVSMAHLRTIIDHPKAFTGQGLTLADVTTERITVLVRKPA